LSNTNGNQYRGDVSVEIDGRPYVLRLGFQQFAALEKHFKVKGWAAVSTKVCGTDVRGSDDDVAVLRILLASHHPEFLLVDVDEVGKLIEAMTQDGIYEEFNVAAAMFSSGQKGAEQVRRRIALIRSGQILELAEEEKRQLEAEAKLKQDPKAQAPISL